MIKRINIKILVSISLAVIILSVLAYAIWKDFIGLKSENKLIDSFDQMSVEINRINQANYIFIARVIRQVGSNDVRDSNGDSAKNSAVQYELEVIRSIKGSLRDKVIVNQFDYFDNLDILKPGLIYLLFSSRTGLDDQPWPIVYPEAVISVDPNLTRSEIESLVLNNPIIKHWEYRYQDWLNTKNKKSKLFF